MDKKYKLILSFLSLFLVLLAPRHLFSEESAFLEPKDISYYKGMLVYKETFQDSPVTYNIENVIRGLRDASQGKVVFSDIKQLEGEIKKFQQEYLSKLRKENLKTAIDFLGKISQLENVNEIIPNQLYYQILEIGIGTTVKENSCPSVKYMVSTLEKGQQEELFTISEPKPISLKNTIKGFAQGVVGMQEGETRILYVHPDLAYGAASARVQPNSLIIFEVTVVRADNSP